MEQLSIECNLRPEGINPRALRREGKLPAVLYGHQGAESVSLVVDAHAAGLLVRKASINNTLVDVSVPELPWSGKALLREVQTHPWKNKIHHISFFSVGAQESVEVVVPVHYTGTPKGVREAGGVLDVMVNELAIKCAPVSIPEVLEVDVTDLVVGDILHIADLKLPAGVEAVADASKAVAMVAAPSKPTAADAAEEAAMAADA